MQKGKQHGNIWIFPGSGNYVNIAVFYEGKGAFFRFDEWRHIIIILHIRDKS